MFPFSHQHPGGLFAVVTPEWLQIIVTAVELELSHLGSDSHPPGADTSRQSSAGAGEVPRHTSDNRDREMPFLNTKNHHTSLKIPQNPGISSAHHPGEPLARKNALSKGNSRKDV